MHRQIFMALLVSTPLLFICGKCFEDEGILAGSGSPTSLLRGSWVLERIVRPTKTLTDSQIGYNEVLEVTGENGYTVENTYQNDSLIRKQYLGPYDGHVLDKKKYTFVIKYRNEAKRFSRFTRLSAKVT